MNPSTKGAWKELLVAADLLTKGWEVYKAVSNAPVDLIIWRGDIILKVEVKSPSPHNSTYVFPEWRAIPCDVLAIVTDSSQINYLAMTSIGLALDGTITPGF